MESKPKITHKKKNLNDVTSFLFICIINFSCQLPLHFNSYDCPLNIILETVSFQLASIQRELSPQQTTVYLYTRFLRKILGTSLTNGTTKNLSGRFFLSDVDGKKPFHYAFGCDVQMRESTCHSRMQT